MSFGPVEVLLEEFFFLEYQQYINEDAQEIANTIVSMVQILKMVHSILSLF